MVTLSPLLATSAAHAGGTRPVMACLFTVIHRSQAERLVITAHLAGRAQESILRSIKRTFGKNRTQSLTHSQNVRFAGAGSNLALRRRYALTHSLPEPNGTRPVEQVRQTAKLLPT